MLAMRHMSDLYCDVPTVKMKMRLLNLNQIAGKRSWTSDDPVVYDQQFCGSLN